jgi:hypothetical protein
MGLHGLLKLYVSFYLKSALKYEIWYLEYILKEEIWCLQSTLKYFHSVMSTCRKYLLVYVLL